MFHSLSRRGFSLIELLVGIFLSIMVLTILAAIVGAVGSKLFFRSTHTGTVVECASLTPQMIVNNTRSVATNPVYSFAVNIQGEEGQILSFSSEDRQFAACNKGDVIRVLVFKYPPWNLDKSGTYYGGRLLQKLKVAETK